MSEEEPRSLYDRVGDMLSALADNPPPSLGLIKNSLADLRQEISDLEYSKEEAEAQVAAFENEKAALKAEQENLEAMNRVQLEKLTQMHEAHRAELKAKNDQLRAAENEIETERKNFLAERKDFQAEKKGLQSEIIATKEELRRIQSQNNENEPLSEVEADILDRVSNGAICEAANLTSITRYNLSAVRVALAQLEGNGFLERLSVGLLPSLVLSKKAKAWLRNRPGPSKMEYEANFPTKRREASEEKIMLMLRGGNELTAAEIARNVGTGLDLTEVALEHLKEANLVSCNQYAQFEYEAKRPATWYLNKFGQRYLAEHELLH